MSDLKDLPGEKSANFLARVREEMQILRGRRGDKLDRALTLRDLLGSGLAALGQGGTQLIPGPGAGGSGGGPTVPVYVIDLTPPPTPTGFAVDAGITNLFISHDAPLYPQGNGHLRTHVYGVKMLPGDPLPTFSAATPLSQFSGTVESIAVNSGETWRLWIKWETNDGVLSADPAGGTNGLEAITAPDVPGLLAALAGQITASELSISLSTPIGQIPGIAATLAQEAIDRAAAIAAEAQARANAIAAESLARANAITTEVDARVASIQAVDDSIREALATADQAVVTSLTSSFQAADATVLANANSYTFSKAESTSAIAAMGTQLTSSFEAGDAAALASAQNFTYSRAAIDSADTATLTTARAEFASADAATLASAQSFTYARATIDSAIATNASTLRAQITGGSTSNDLGTLTSGLLYQERLTRATQDAALSQQITLLSAGAGEQFDYRSIWYFDSSVEGWTSNNTSGVVISSVAGWLRLVAASGTQTERHLLSPDLLGIEGAKYPQIRVRIRKVGSPVWRGHLWFTTTADNTFTTGKRVTFTEPSYDANGISVITINAPATWTGATVRRVRLDFSADVTTANYFELDWAAIGRPSPGASSAQLADEQVARANADSALASDITTLTTSVGGKADASALSSLDTRVTAAEGVNTSQGSSITSLNNSITTINGTLGDKADTSALTALTTRVTNAEGVNTSQAGSITSLNSSLETTNGNVTTAQNAANAANTNANTRATSTALDTLNTQVQHSTTGLSATATRVGSLETSVNNPSTGLTSKASNSRVDQVVIDANGALSAAVQTLEASIANAGGVTGPQLTAAIQVETTARATADGELYARFTVKTDVAGLVSGYGLASGANNAAPSSAFGIQAGQFFVSDPAIVQTTAPTVNRYRGMLWLDTSVNPAVRRFWSGTAWSTTPQALPFVVQVVPTEINGVVVDPGIYAENAFFGRLVATRGQIGLLAVDDARIASLSATKLTAGSIAVGQTISSTGQYSGGDPNWSITGAGLATFNNAVVRGTVFATNGQFLGTLLGGSASGFGSGLGMFSGWTGTSTDANYRWRVGSPTGARLQWTGSAVEIYNGSNQLTLSSGGVDWGAVNGRPTSLAGLDSAAGSKLTGIAAGATVGADWNGNLSNRPPNAQLVNNLIDPSTWVPNAHGGAPGFNPNGSVWEQYRTEDILPDGSRGTVWMCYPGLFHNNAYGWDAPQAGSEAAGEQDGGWNTDSFSIDSGKTYRFAVWVMRFGGTSGGTYFGTGSNANGVLNMPSGSLDTNPYFWSGSLPQLNRWYLVVGYVRPHGSRLQAQANAGGVWDSTNGQKVFAGTDFAWPAGATTAVHRAYLYYSAPGSHQYMVWPRVDLCNGSEPSIQQLLAMGAVSGGNPITAGNASTYIANAAIGSAQIENASITRAKIQGAAIGEAQIEDAAITSAKIGNAQITSAKIGVAQIDTLKIAGNAVTVPVGWRLASDYAPPLNMAEVTLFTTTVDPQGGGVYASFVGASVGYKPVGEFDPFVVVTVRLYMNGALQASSANGPFALAGFLSAATTVTVTAQTNSGDISSNARIFAGASVFVIGTKR